MFRYKIYETDSNVLLAIADSDIVGTRLEQGNKIVEVSREFYDYGVIDESEVLEKLRSVNIVNAFGNEIVKFLLDAGAIEKTEVVEVCGIMHAQIFVV